MTSNSTRPRSTHSRRRAGAVAGVALVATGALAVPALALSRDDDASAAPTAAAVAASSTTVVPTTDPSTTLPAATEVATPPVAEAPADPAVVFATWWDAATPEQRLAFQFATMTPEEAAAFKTFVTPPPAPAPKPQVTTSSGGGNIGGFLACVRNRESRGNYRAVNGSSGAAGAYQFLPGTWNNTARHAGRPDLVGVNPANAAPGDQDAMAQHLYAWQGRSPWAGDGC